MTEAEWLASRDPDALLEFLRQEAYCRRRPHPSRRKVRLFACACCRRAWPFLAERSRRAVEMAERYADRRATRQELALAFAAARSVNSPGNGGLAALAVAAPSGNPDRAARQAALAGDIRRWDAERAAQAELLRDIFGNPFVPAPVIDPAWLTGSGGAVAELARDIYAEGVFDRLPLLTAALAEAGGGGPALAAHFRAPEAHVRGCWALDLLLGKS